MSFHLLFRFVVEDGVLVLFFDLSTTATMVAYWSDCGRRVTLPSCVTMRLWLVPVALLELFLLKTTKTATANINKPRITSLRFMY